MAPVGPLCVLCALRLRSQGGAGPPADDEGRSALPGAFRGPRRPAQLPTFAGTNHQSPLTVCPALISLAREREGLNVWDMSKRDRPREHGVAGLHVLTDTSIQHRFSHGQLADFAARGGARVVQMRAKTATTRHLLEWGQEVSGACRAHGCLFLVNDHVDVALALGADGVHLGQDDMPVAIARRLLGDNAVVGSSVHSLAELRRAEDEGATYVAFGPVYRTATKVDVGPVRGLQQLSVLCESSTLPVIAIGGVGPDQVRELLAVGVAGVGVVSAVCLDPEPLEATREFVRALEGRAGRP